ncbi:DUF4041 domain-containing protein [Neptuniibacter sp. QD37_6]|uniref:GIY-YIG nuclease family protein n=1 Tax=Neptuniibacter sp. QD37_6 TaxID=3398210 RepID=UPI0039F54F3E
MESYGVVIGSLCLAFLFLVLWVLASIKKSKLLKEEATLQEELSEKQKQISSLSSQVSELSPFQSIVDIDKEIRKRKKEAKENILGQLADAKHEAEKLKREAESMHLEAETDSKEMLKEARSSASAIRSKADEQLKSAHEQATTIMDRAREDAKQIAGDALEAKEKADLWQAAATAARNTIKGYGDEYIIPASSILDNLAEDFSHKDAGAKLKEARAHTKNLIKQEAAAECDYVEKHRKETAIRFILDAYIGKTDSALGKVKHNNLGKLQQQIEDALQLVNYNGSAFRNARITNQFHKSRLEELQWAVAASELQLQEREEQKRIKEQMREEERARREYEKALKETEKEEKMLQKAMEKARAELQSASDEQRTLYEERLADLEQKLQDAEEKNQRALSMAQQTKRGHVYVISNIGSFGEHVYKVGMTRRLEPMDRVKELGDASVPFSFDVHAMIYSEDAPSLEKMLHRKFEHVQVNKMNPRKEFFRVPLAEIKEVVSETEKEVHWTMTAEAVEYRETQALEKALREGNKLSEQLDGLAVH